MWRSAVSAVSRLDGDMSHMVLSGLVCLPDLTENVESSDPNGKGAEGEDAALAGGCLKEKEKENTQRTGCR